MGVLRLYFVVAGGMVLYRIVMLAIGGLSGRPAAAGSSPSQRRAFHWLKDPIR